MIQDDKLSISGNFIYEKWGRFLNYTGSLIKELGESISKRGTNIELDNKVKIVTNPTARLVNPYTLIINFRVDNSNKYQILLQGDYKEAYKDRDENDSPQIDERTLFIIINERKKDWFLKD